MQKFIPQDYQDFLARYVVDVPAQFNFAFDVVDHIAEKEPDRPAMVHIDEAGHRRDFTMRFFSEESLKVAAGLAAVIGLAGGAAAKAEPALRARIRAAGAMRLRMELSVGGSPDRSGPGEKTPPAPRPAVGILANL